jgi:brefeldin A-inhibited guanine nucleotide-exchange protein
MTRIRLVWSRIWAELSDYFVIVGCAENLSVAMYAVDSLRQLAMKFLERDELANYNFQNDFLKPFVVIMRKSNSVEIRELIIRCMSQMVLARVGNVKSGWKVMFMVRDRHTSHRHIPDCMHLNESICRWWSWAHAPSPEVSQQRPTRC